MWRDQRGRAVTALLSTMALRMPKSIRSRSERRTPYQRRQRDDSGRIFISVFPRFRTVLEASDLSEEYGSVTVAVPASPDDERDQLCPNANGTISRGVNLECSKRLRQKIPRDTPRPALPDFIFVVTGPKQSQAVAKVGQVGDEFRLDFTYDVGVRLR